MKHFLCFVENGKENTVHASNPTIVSFPQNPGSRGNSLTSLPQVSRSSLTGQLISQTVPSTCSSKQASALGQTLPSSTTTTSSKPHPALVTIVTKAQTSSISQNTESSSKQQQQFVTRPNIVPQTQKFTPVVGQVPNTVLLPQPFNIVTTPAVQTSRAAHTLPFQLAPLNLAPNIQVVNSQVPFLPATLPKPGHVAIQPVSTRVGVSLQSLMLSSTSQALLDTQTRQNLTLQKTQGISSIFPPHVQGLPIQVVPVSNYPTVATATAPCPSPRPRSMSSSHVEEESNHHKDLCRTSSLSNLARSSISQTCKPTPPVSIATNTITIATTHVSQTDKTAVTMTTPSVDSSQAVANPNAIESPSSFISSLFPGISYKAVTTQPLSNTQPTIPVTSQQTTASVPLNNSFSSSKVPCLETNNVISALHTVVSQMNKPDSTADSSRGAVGNSSFLNPTTVSQASLRTSSTEVSSSDAISLGNELQNNTQGLTVSSQVWNTGGLTQISSVQSKLHSMALSSYKDPILGASAVNSLPTTSLNQTSSYGQSTLANPTTSSQSVCGIPSENLTLEQQQFLQFLSTQNSPTGDQSPNLQRLLSAISELSDKPGANQSEDLDDTDTQGQSFAEEVIYSTGLTDKSARGAGSGYGLGIDIEELFANAGGDFNM